MILGELFGIESARAVRATEKYRALTPGKAAALYTDMSGMALRKAPVLLVVAIFCGSMTLRLVTLAGYRRLTGQSSGFWWATACSVPYVVSFWGGLYLAIRGRAWFLLKEHLQNLDRPLNATEDEGLPHLTTPESHPHNAPPESYVDL
jgi:hypothetical protein